MTSILKVKAIKTRPKFQPKQVSFGFQDVPYTYIYKLYIHLTSQGQLGKIPQQLEQPGKDHQKFMKRQRTFIEDLYL